MLVELFKTPVSDVIEAIAGGIVAIQWQTFGRGGSADVMEIADYRMMRRP